MGYGGAGTALASCLGKARAACSLSRDMSLSPQAPAGNSTPSSTAPNTQSSGPRCAPALTCGGRKPSALLAGAPPPSCLQLVPSPSAVLGVRFLAWVLCEGFPVPTVTEL